MLCDVKRNDTLQYAPFITHYKTYFPSLRRTSTITPAKLGGSLVSYLKYDGYGYAQNFKSKILRFKDDISRIVSVSRTFAQSGFPFTT